MNDKTMQRLVELFKDILFELSNGPGMRILLIIDGLEACECEEIDNYRSHLRSFFRNLQVICDQDQAGSNAVVKVLLGYKGHAMTLYDCVKAEDIVDVTSLPTSSTSLMQDLALKLNDIGSQGDLPPY